MNDPYPERMVIEIDRKGLRRWRRARAFLLWMQPMVIVGIVGFAIGMDAVQKNPVANPLSQFLTAASRPVGFGFVACVVGYLICSHFFTGRIAAQQRFAVDGAHIVFQTGGMFSFDHRLHFSAVYDYVILDGPLMRLFGIKRLLLATPAGAVLVDAVQDCDKIRGMLEDMDRYREHGATPH